MIHLLRYSPQPTIHSPTIWLLNNSKTLCCRCHTMLSSFLSFILFVELSCIFNVWCNSIPLAKWSGMQRPQQSIFMHLLRLVLLSLVLIFIEFMLLNEQKIVILWLFASSRCVCRNRHKMLLFNSDTILLPNHAFPSFFYIVARDRINI